MTRTHARTHTHTHTHTNHCNGIGKQSAWQEEATLMACKHHLQLTPTDISLQGKGKKQ